VWCSPGRNTATLQAFFTELGERRHSIRAISIDMSGGYAKAIGDNTRAEICFDPFHVMRVRLEALLVRAGARPRRGAVAAAR
jgi:transposase